MVMGAWFGADMTADPASVLTAWLDVSAGAAGDMICGALIDIGAPLDTVQAGVEAVIPGRVRLRTQPVLRAGLRATKLSVDVLSPDQAHRPWAAIRTLLARSALPPPVMAGATAVFGRLAEAESRVHGVTAEEVEFHEVGSLDSIADIIGTCMALDALGVRSLRAGPMALGNGHVMGAHGLMPVPVPAVLELVRGWQVVAGGEGELATPTGAAIITTLAENCVALPPLTVQAVGVGAGDRDTPGRPNVVRVVLGSRTGEIGEFVSHESSTAAVVLETNVDDLDPRLWPGVLVRLLEAGASDAWLTPILMKKGRPAHTLSVLASPERIPELRQFVFQETSAIGLRETSANKHALDRTWVRVDVAGESVRMKVATSGETIIHTTPEFDDVAAAAANANRPVRDVLEDAVAAAVGAGLVPGSPAPRSAQ